MLLRSLLTQICPRAFMAQGWVYAHLDATVPSSKRPDCGTEEKGGRLKR